MTADPESTDIPSWMRIETPDQSEEFIKRMVVDPKFGANLMSWDADFVHRLFDVEPRPDDPCAGCGAADWAHTNGYCPSCRLRRAMEAR